MKIVMFAPGLKASAIGRVAGLAIRELALAGHDVTFVRSEETKLLELVPREFGVPVLAWTDSNVVEEACQGADVVIHHIGDNYSYHQGSLEWLLKYPSMVCLHDYFLGHLFCGWAQSRREEAERILAAWYGSDAASGYFGCVGKPDFIDATRAIMPMTEWLCAMATAVLTHSSWGIDRVLCSCAGPVRCVPLPYEMVDQPDFRTGNRPSSTRFLNVLTVGHVNANKRAASVIRAIGSSEKLRDRCVYRLAGHIDAPMADELSRLARGQRVHLVISGEVDDAALVRALDEASVVSCLRWPSLEAASASAIEAMLHGKPTIVTNTGFYQELPGDYVIKIDATDELPQLRRALEHLLDDEGARIALGARAREWAAATFSAAAYAHALVETATWMSAAWPIIDAANAAVRTMASWNGLQFIDPQEMTASLEIFNGASSK